MIQYFTVFQAFLLLTFGAMFGTGLTMMLTHRLLSSRIAYEEKLRSERLANEEKLLAAHRTTPTTAFWIKPDDVMGHPDPSMRAAANMDSSQKARMSELIQENRQRRAEEDRLRLTSALPTDILETVPSDDTRIIPTLKPPPEVAIPTFLPASSRGRHRAPSASPLAAVQASFVAKGQGGRYVPQPSSPVTETDLLSLKAVAEYSAQRG